MFRNGAMTFLLPAAAHQGVGGGWKVCLESSGIIRPRYNKGMNRGLRSK